MYAHQGAVGAVCVAGRLLLALRKELPAAALHVTVGAKCAHGPCGRGSRTHSVVGRSRCQGREDVYGPAVGALAPVHSDCLERTSRPGTPPSHTHASPIHIPRAMTAAWRRCGPRHIHMRSSHEVGSRRWRPRGGRGKGGVHIAGCGRSCGPSDGGPTMTRGTAFGCRRHLGMDV